jgi:hypothetical protein
MSYFAMAAIEILGVRCSQPLHDPGENNIACLQEKVHMIGHEDICIERKAEALLGLIQSPKVLTAVRVVKKDTLLPISTD